MSLFDSEKKYVPGQDAVLAAENFLHQQLSPWQDGDEWRLSCKIDFEGGRGWEPVDCMGRFVSLDQRRIAAFAWEGSRGQWNNPEYRMLVTTSRESFSYFFRGTTQGEIWYGNDQIGWIDSNFSVYNKTGQKIMETRVQTVDFNPQGRRPLILANSVATSFFQLYTGLTGWFNVPPQGAGALLEKDLPQSRAIGLKQGQHLPSEEERKWILASYFLLRAGPMSGADYKPSRLTGFWDIVY